MLMLVLSWKEDNQPVSLLKCLAPSAKPPALSASHCHAVTAYILQLHLGFKLRCRCCCNAVCIPCSGNTCVHVRLQQQTHNITCEGGGWGGQIVSKQCCSQ